MGEKLNMLNDYHSFECVPFKTKIMAYFLSTDLEARLTKDQ